MGQAISRTNTWDNDLRTTVLAWYSANAREFLWRERQDISRKGNSPPEPYLVLVSETMLQQTQTSRVQEKLPAFLRQFPTLSVLAAASNAEIITAWEGMGYNSRALRLRDCAKAIIERYSGKIPPTIEELRSLPGIGPYTASAIAAFAFHSDVAVVDVNIRRVYSRLLRAMPTTADVLPEAELTAFAERTFPRGQSSAWHQAIMDIGAMFCTARAPKCALCPVRKLCASANNMAEAVRTKKAEPSFDGIPNRIWRGRVVQLLRKVPMNTWSDSTTLYNQLFSASLFTTTEREQWFSRLLQGLERDAIVEITHGRQRASSSDNEPHTSTEEISTEQYSVFVRLAS